MGLNAVVAFQVAAATGSWQAAMALVVVEGLLVLALVLLGLREAVMDAIPLDLRRAIGVGIGLFIAFIGAVNARLVVVPAGTVSVLAENPSAILPPVTYGSLRSLETAVALTGLLVIAILFAQRRTGAILIGILAATVLALAVGVTDLPADAWVTLPRFTTVGQADFRAVATLAAVPLVLSLVMVDFFDTIGTATAIGDAAHLHDAQGRLPRLRSVLAVDAVSASIGGFFGASSVTSYIESAAGAAEGARTGLHSVIVGLLFAGAVFFAPLAAIVPAAATAPALLAVGFLMTQQVTRIDFHALDTAIPAFVILVLIPLTWSIAHGIGYGFLVHVAIRLLSGRARDVHPVTYGTAEAFGACFLVESLATRSPWRARRLAGTLANKALCSARLCRASAPARRTRLRRWRTRSSVADTDLSPRPDRVGPLQRASLGTWVYPRYVACGRQVMISRLHGCSYLGRRRYFVTCCVRDRTRVFDSHEAAEIVESELLRTAAAYGFAVCAYCVMPDHLHALVQGAKAQADFRLFMRCFRGRTRGRTGKSQACPSGSAAITIESYELRSRRSV